MASLLIPKRPHSSFGTRQGSAYFAHVKEVAHEELGPHALYPVGFVSVTLDLYFALAEDAPAGLEQRPECWGAFNIPRADKASEMILSALKGALYADTRQAVLSVNRHLKTKRYLSDIFGADSKRGCAVVHHAPCGSSLEAARRLETYGSC